MHFNCERKTAFKTMYLEFKLILEGVQGAIEEYFELTNLTTINAISPSVTVEHYFYR